MRYIKLPESEVPTDNSHLKGTVRKSLNRIASELANGYISEGLGATYSHLLQEHRERGMPGSSEQYQNALDLAVNGSVNESLVLGAPFMPKLGVRNRDLAIKGVLRSEDPGVEPSPGFNPSWLYVLTSSSLPTGLQINNVTIPLESEEVIITAKEGVLASLISHMMLHWGIPPHLSGSWADALAPGENLSETFSGNELVDLLADRLVQILGYPSFGAAIRECAKYLRNQGYTLIRSRGHLAKFKVITDEELPTTYCRALEETSGESSERIFAIPSGRKVMTLLRYARYMNHLLLQNRVPLVVDPGFNYTYEYGDSERKMRGFRYFGDRSLSFFQPLKDANLVGLKTMVYDADPVVERLEIDLESMFRPGWFSGEDDAENILGFRNHLNHVKSMAEDLSQRPPVKGTVEVRIELETRRPVSFSPRIPSGFVDEIFLGLHASDPARYPDPSSATGATLAEAFLSQAVCEGKDWRKALPLLSTSDLLKAGERVTACTGKDVQGEIAAIWGSEELSSGVLYRGMYASDPPSQVRDLLAGMPSAGSLEEGSSRRANELVGKILSLPYFNYTRVLKVAPYIPACLLSLSRKLPYDDIAVDFRPGKR
jgi:hypothetical protein